MFLEMLFSSDLNTAMETFAYDDDQNLTEDGSFVYAWDPNEGDSGDWSATAELDLRFIYHERLLLLELDGATILEEPRTSVRAVLREG